MADTGDGLYVTVVEDNTDKVLTAMRKAILSGLESVGKRAQGYAQDIVPVKTGNLQASIRYNVDEDGYTVYIGTNVSYAAYVEFGTIKMDAQPYLRPAAQNHGSEYRAILENALRNA